MHKKLSALFVAGILTSAALTSAAPAAAASKCADTSKYGTCGVVKVHAKSQCAAVSFGGWSNWKNGYGTGGEIVRPGKDSKQFHADSDGTDPDDRCNWWQVGSTGQLRGIPFSSKPQKNWGGYVIYIYGQRK